MKKIVLSLVVMLTVGFSAFSAEKCLPVEQVTPEKVNSIISPVLGGVKVIKVSKTPIKNIYEVVVETRGKVVPAYIDCTLRYFITGNVIDLKERRSLTIERAKQLAKEAEKKKLEELKKVIGEKKARELKNVLGERFNDIKIINPDQIPKKHLVTYGNPDAKLTVYVVTDPECPYCARFDTEMKKVLKKRKDVKFEIILYPLPFHRHAGKISQKIICEKSAEEKRKILEKSFEAVRENRTDKLEKLGGECEKGQKALEEHMMFGAKSGISGTPTLIFPHGIVISGWMTADQINRVLDVLK
ncbi:DsbC family protein [Persephonella sp.]